MSEDAAGDFGLTIGDTVSINVLGREITATIANLREVDWQSFQINFVFVLNPGVLDAAPHSWIATTHADSDAAADAVERAVTSNFSNISAVSVKEAGGNRAARHWPTWRCGAVNRPCHPDRRHCRFLPEPLPAANHNGLLTR
jgi:predicted lysophospholipase L1 biosynthesis ABC-type transport system permease subunit